MKKSVKESVSKNENNKRILIRFVTVIVINVSVLTGGVLLYLLYNRTGRGIDCQIHKFTGCYCPSCGATRMMYSLIHDLDLRQAFRYNPMLFLTLPVAFVLYVPQLAVFVRTGGLSDWMVPVIKVWGVLMVLFCILRNTPAFYFLAPTAL
ncbi:MAG: DUF2752 domain-containing protein [Lachnospiraceae bacterium]|nr:DUF2752 domain-containing protein [Lachnospiraceae bacterium]